MTRSVLIITAAFCIAGSTTNAQKGEQMEFLLTSDRVVRAVLLHMNDSTLYVDAVHETWSPSYPVNYDDITIVPLGDVQHVGYHGGSKIWSQMGIGAVIGGVGGALIGAASYKKPEPRSGQILMGDFGPGGSTIGGALIGGLIGMFTGLVVGSVSSETTVDLRSDNPEFLSELRDLVLYEGKIPVTMAGY